MNIKPHWLLVTAAVSMSAAAGAPPESSAKTASPPPRSEMPDDALIEFLGADDVPDAHWWDYLSRRGSGGDVPAPPPKGSKQ